MKIFSTSIILILCLVWIFFTSYRFYPINAVGELLTFGSGLLSIPLERDGGNLIQNSRFKATIHVDDYGIPHIYSNNKDALAFGLGYMHAKDRYFQMELMSRMVLGEMSELFGEKTWKSDVFWKPFEFYRKGKEILEEYQKEEPELYSYLMAYATGVNTYLANNKINDPLYKIFNSHPRNWKPEYSLLVTWYMSGNLAYFDYHQEQQELIDKLSEEVFQFFYPMHPDDINTILSEELNPIHLAVNIRDSKKVASELSVTDNFNKDVGSNNWALNKGKTKNANPILANDPHLFLTLPGPFYEAHLVSNEVKIYGFSIPGIPLIVSGHNDKVAWGITNGEWDLTNRYLLKVKADSLYFYDGKWIPFQQKQYMVNVRGKGKEAFIQKSTVHGKVIEDENGNYFAQKWYASDKNHSVKAMFQMMQSQNWGSFKKALKSYDYPPQNFIYSDVYDTIGIICAGNLPDRPSGFRGGLMNGDERQEVKERVIDDDTLWYLQNPASKFLFSANQQPIQNDQYFGAHWHKDDFRVNRIFSLLEEKNDWDVESIQKMQQDVVDLSFYEVRKLFYKYSIPVSYRSIAETLKSWNGTMEAESNEASLYEILRASTEKEAERFAKHTLKVTQAPSFKYFVKYLNQDEMNIPRTITKQAMFESILQRTDSIWRSNLGKNKEVRESILVYNISFLPGFGVKLKGIGGNKNTIQMNAKAHPVFKSVFELEKENIRGFTIMAGGQSGKINSPHYKDQLKFWKDGKYLQTQFVDNPTNLKNIQTTIIFE